MTQRSVLLTIPSFAVMALVGCHGNQFDQAPVPGENGLALLAPAPGDGVQMRFFERDTAPGSEYQVCRNFIVPKGGWDIDRIDHEYVVGSHHIIIYRQGSLSIPMDDTGANVNTDDTFKCGDVPGPIFYSSGTPVDHYQYPDGVGLHFDAGSVIRLELHWINATTSKRTSEVRANLMFAKNGITTEAGALFFYNLNIAIAPHTSQSVRMRCEIPGEINIIGVVPHAHVYNTTMYARAVSADVPADAVTASTSREIVRTKGFGDELQRPYSPPFVVHSGEILDYGCEYTNNTDNAIVEGPKKIASEMCLFIANYYPRVLPAAELCFLPGSGAVRNPYGKMSCGEALTCQQQNRKIHGFRSLEERSCWLNICKKSEPALDSFQNCIYQNCTTCTTDDDCNSCAEIACGNEALACMVTGC